MQSVYIVYKPWKSQIIGLKPYEPQNDVTLAVDSLVWFPSFKKN